MTALNKLLEKGKLKTVGIIDDDELFSTIMTRQLERAGMQVLFNAPDGKRGIAELQLLHTLPGVMIVDIEMPVMDGFEVVKYLKRTWPFLQIIAHSSLTRAAVHQQIIADGADVFILKQPNALPLINAIKKLSAVTVNQEGL